MAESVDVGGRGSFAEHLDDRVARDEVDEKEDDGDDDPEDGEGEEDAAQRLPVIVALRGPEWRFGRNTGIPRLGASRFARNDICIVRGILLRFA